MPCSQIKQKLKNQRLLCTKSSTVNGNPEFLFFSSAAETTKMEVLPMDGDEKEEKESRFRDERIWKNKKI